MKKALACSLALLFLSACGDTNSKDTTVDPTASPSPTAAPEPTATPQPGESPEPTPTPTPDFGEKGACITPVSPAAEVTVTEGPACLICDVETPEAITTLNRQDSARLSMSLGLVPESGLSDLAVTVSLGEAQQPVADQGADAGQPGFLVSFPDVSLLTAAIAPVLNVDALANGEIVETATYGFGFFDRLVLGLVGVDINNAQVYLPVEATAPYDALRLSLTGGLATVLLNVDVHAACVAGVGGSISGDF